MLEGLNLVPFGTDHGFKETIGDTPNASKFKNVFQSRVRRAHRENSYWLEFFGAHGAPYYDTYFP